MIPRTANDIIMSIILTLIQYLTTKKQTNILYNYTGTSDNLLCRNLTSINVKQSFYTKYFAMSFLRAVKLLFSHNV